MIGSFGWMELLLILIIVLIIFGAGKIPQLGEGLGKAIKGFKKSVNEADALDVSADQQEGAPQQYQYQGQQAQQGQIQGGEQGGHMPQPGQAHQPQEQPQGHQADGEKVAQPSAPSQTQSQSS